MSPEPPGTKAKETAVAASAARITATTPTSGPPRLIVLPPSRRLALDADPLEAPFAARVQVCSAAPYQARAPESRRPRVGTRPEPRGRLAPVRDKWMRCA